LSCHRIAMAAQRFADCNCGGINFKALG